MISNGKKHLQVGALGYLMKDCLPEELIKAIYRARLLEKMHMKTNGGLIGCALKHKLIE